MYIPALDWVVTVLFLLEEGRVRAWYFLALSSCSSALTSLPKHALLNFVFPLTSFPLQTLLSRLWGLSAGSPLPMLACRVVPPCAWSSTGASLSFPLLWTKGNCPAHQQPWAASSQPEMQEEKQDVSFLFIIRCLGIGLESHLSGLRMWGAPHPPQTFLGQLWPPLHSTHRLVFR